MSVKLLFAHFAAPSHCFPDHPERPQRVFAIETSLSSDQQLGPHIIEVNTPHPEPLLESVHQPTYLDAIRQLCTTLIVPTVLRDPDDPDGPTYATPSTFSDACSAAAAAAHLVSKVIESSSSVRPVVAFSACRPPGHHATHNEAMGFCFLNSVAIAARHAQRVHGLTKICIIDIDVHSGNGTQDIFDGDDTVFFIDMHRHGVWPGSGNAAELGSGKGQGCTMNIPLPDGSGHVVALKALENVIVPAIRRFVPELILVSAGFDAHRCDPLESLAFQSATYHAIAHRLVSLATELCEGRCVFVLEGGYDVASLGEASLEMARGAVGLPPLTSVLQGEGGLMPHEPLLEAEKMLQEVRSLHGLAGS